ncbi:MAG: redox-sensitive transcriptional activator SoxR [Pseudomonadota bacterium]
MRASDMLSIGDVAHRTGLAVSAIRYYEEQGLIQPERNRGNQRRFLRSDIRRLSFIVIAQRLGFAISEISDLFADLPNRRTPTRGDWQRFSTQFRARLDAKIQDLEALRGRLDGCIGCGCLSLEHCAIYNPQDDLGRQGPGPRNIHRSVSGSVSER